MAYDLDICVPADAEALAKVHLAVAQSSPRFHVTYGACAHDDLLSMWAQDFRDAINGTNEQDPDFPKEHYYLKAVDSMTNEIAGFVIWSFLPNGYNHEDDPELVRKDSKHPKGLNIAVLEEFSGKIEGLRRKYADGIKPLWLLALLGTHPDHRGKGLAGRLVRHVFPQADVEGATCYVDSSAAGLPVYKKCGFQEVDSISLDLEKYERGEGMGKANWTALLRRPGDV